MPLTIPFLTSLRPSVKRLVKRLTSVTPQEPKLTVGLDVGFAAVKAVALGARRGNGARPVIGHSLVPLQPGQDADPSAAIKQALSELKVPVWTATLGVSGQWVIMRIVEMPTMKLGELKQALAFEAQRYLPFNLQEVVIDAVMLGPSDASKTWVLIVACKKELLERKIDWGKRSGVAIGLVDVDALAITNAFLANVQSENAFGACAIINVGAQLTNLVILKGRTPHLVRDIPWGGDKLIRNVAEQMGMEADAVTRQLAQQAPQAEMLNALKLSVGTLVTELQLSFDYFENRFNQPPEAIFASGGLSQSKSFLEALKSHLTQPVTPWSPSPELSGEFAVAYGLALKTA